MQRERERKEERIFLLISGGYGRKDDDGDDAALRSRAYWVASTLWRTLHICKRASQRLWLQRRLGWRDIGNSHANILIWRSRTRRGSLLCYYASLIVSFPSRRKESQYPRVLVWLFVVGISWVSTCKLPRISPVILWVLSEYQPCFYILLVLFYMT